VLKRQGESDISVLVKNFIYLYKMNKYAAFLRGINVSGKNLIKMDALRASLTALSLQDVKTYL
jgi:hypothetical protein